jgi:hypothetical protein
MLSGTGDRITVVTDSGMRRDLARQAVASAVLSQDA